jgi:hypothetical protein
MLDLAYDLTDTYVPTQWNWFGYGSLAQCSTSAQATSKHFAEFALYVPDTNVVLIKLGWTLFCCMFHGF